MDEREHMYRVRSHVTDSVEHHSVGGDVFRFCGFEREGIGEYERRYNACERGIKQGNK